MSLYMTTLFLTGMHENAGIYFEKPSMAQTWSRHTLPVFHSDLYEAYVHSNLRCMDEDLFV